MLYSWMRPYEWQKAEVTCQSADDSAKSGAIKLFERPRDLYGVLLFFYYSNMFTRWQPCTNYYVRTFSALYLPFLLIIIIISRSISISNSITKRVVLIALLASGQGTAPGLLSVLNIHKLPLGGGGRPSLLGSLASIHAIIRAWLQITRH